MKQITITLNVEPAAAIRSGKATCGEVSMTLSDEDLARLTPEQRETLAKHVAKERCDGCGPEWGTRLSDYAPDIDHVSIEVLQSLLDTRRELVTTRMARRQSAADEEILAAIAKPAAFAKRWIDNTEGSLCEWGGLVSIEWPISPYCSSSTSNASEPVRAAWKAHVAQVEARQRAAVEAALPAARVEAERRAVLRAAEETAKVAKEAKARDEYAALYLRLPEVLRARHEEGYATDSEVKGEMRRLLRADEGYPTTHKGWEKSEKLSQLSDEEFGVLLDAKAGAPKGATVEAKACWDSAWRPAEEDEEGDEDGEVYVRANLRRQVVIIWTRGGVQVTAVVPLPKPAAG
jgi:hypothetical protein